jgi:hypothetical protein
MLIGVVYGAYLMHKPTHWIAVGAIVLFRRRDSLGS